MLRRRYGETRIETCKLLDASESGADVSGGARQACKGRPRELDDVSDALPDALIKLGLAVFAIELLLAGL